MTDDFFADDIHFMEMALELAAQGEGRVSPNPPVGCVLVKSGVAVGKGWHNRLGDLHAEAMALREAGENARGATCYVTLSPCATAGRQPPCADALIRAGVAEVVAGSEDPNPKNASGLDVLRRAGVVVRSCLLKDECEYLARGFFKVMRHQLPYLTLKYAMTLDGKIASFLGDSRWISGPASRELVQDFRSRSDAIMVGSGTALQDDPLLTVRDPVLAERGGPAEHPQPVRVIVDSRGRLPHDAALLDPEKGPGGKVFVATTDKAPAEKLRRLEKAGAELLVFSDREKRVPLRELLTCLAGRGINTILCEGGEGLAGGLMSECLVDEVIAFIAPKLVGGRDAPGPVGGAGLACMADAVQLQLGECIPVGNDIMIKAFTKFSRDLEK